MTGVQTCALPICVDADAEGTRLAFAGWNRGTVDTLGVAVVPVDGSAPAIWAKSYAEGGGVDFLNDGSLLFKYRPTQESVALLQVRGPGNITRLGTVPRPVDDISVSGDLKRIAVVERDYHGDAWMSRIVRP